MALLVVVLTIAALAILATPFMVSMRLQERNSRTAIAAARARYALHAACNHAIAQLLRATNEYGEMAVSFVGLPSEFVWQKGQRSMMLAAKVEDEQGKLNLNTASTDAMAGLFADPEVGLGLSGAAAEQLAGAVAQYRQSNGPLPTLEELVALGAVSVEQLNALRPHVTVHSLIDERGLARVNINTCSTAVLRAALSGVRLSFVEPVADPANTGDGAMSVVALMENVDGVWEVRCTDVQTDANTDAKTFTFAVESYPENDPADRTTEGDFSLVELPNQPGRCSVPVLFWINGAKARFSLYNGATDFAVGDKFTFSAERFSYNRTEFSPDKVNTLLKRFRAVVVSADTAAGTITLDDASRFPPSGWVRIQSDLIRYASRDGHVLQGCTDIAAAPVAGAAVALIVPDMATLDGILADAVADGDIRESDRAAIIANAKDPAGASLLDATVGFCFRPAGRYLIEAEGLVNDAAGRLESRASTRRIVALDRGAAGAWTLDVQGDFDEQVAAFGRSGLITLPGASYVSDVPPAGGDGDAGVSLAPIDEGGFGWGFDGPTLFGAGNWSSASPGGTPVPGTTLRDKLFLNGDKGLWVSGTDAFRAFGARDLLAVDATLRRLMLWVKPGESFAYNANHTFFDSGLTNMSDAADFHTNRILLAYQSGGTLLFRLADEARENRSAEIRAPVPPEQFAAGAWHRIEALWGGMEIGRMALVLDGRLIGTYSPSGAAAEATASPSLPDEKWIALVANHLRQQGEPDAVRDTQIGSTTGPKSVYGYGACTFINKDASTRKAAFDRVHRGGARLVERIENALVTTLKIKQLPPPEPPVTLLPDALIIPVADAAGFPKQGYVKIDDKEIARYTNWTYNATDSCYELVVPEGGRGCDFGDNLATQYSTDAAEHSDGRQVVCISVRVTDNSMYPMPHLLDVPADVENYFGLTGLDPNTCMVQVDDEWIAYTHRAGTEFLVHVQAKTAERKTSETKTITTSSMRGAGGTYVAPHASNANVLPVYEVALGGRLGGGDRVTLLDDGLAPQGGVERVLHRVSGSAVSFADFLPDDLDLYIKKGTSARNARMVKFPSGRFRPQRFVSIGAPMSGAGGRAESTIGCVRFYEHSSSSAGLRIKEPVAAGTSLIVFGTLGALYNGGTEWPWSDDDFGVKSWPLCGYVKVGDEAFLYKVRYPHNIGYSGGVGAVSQSASATVRGAIAATGNVVWQRQGAEDDPIKLGFNPHGGYMMITSYKRTATSGTTRSLNGCSNEILQWLIQQGYVTQQYVDANGTQNPDGTWSFPDIVTEGGWSTSESREFVFYSDLNPKTPGADEYTFTCDAGRHLYNTHMNGAIPLGHDPADDGEGGTIYPRLTARTVALAILQRGGAAGTLALGSARADHDAGSAILPLPNAAATILSGPPRNEDGAPAAAFEGDMLPVESTAQFPDSGYLEIASAAGEREIIYYTGKESELIPGSNPERRRYFFVGIRNFRGRFGTTPIDLSGLSKLADVRDTSDAALAACRDERRAVRLFQPRFHDRMPLRITMAGGIEQSREYAPHAADIDVLCFEAKKTVRGANWLSLGWAEELPPGTDIVVLARVGGSPDWATAEPVRWNEVPASGSRVIYKFDTPGDDNTINVRGDTIAVRVFFKFNPGYDLSRWQTPVLKSLTVRYEAGPSVLESQVLD